MGLPGGWSERPRIRPGLQRLWDVFRCAWELRHPAATGFGVVRLPIDPRVVESELNLRGIRDAETRYTYAEVIRIVERHMSDREQHKGGDKGLADA